jgi:hypothetical protein
MVKYRHAEHLDFLRHAIRPGCVVMTHFAPSWRSIPSAFENDPRNGYYASSLEDLIEETRPAVWVHGHIHTAWIMLSGIPGSPAIRLDMTGAGTTQSLDSRFRREG